MEKMILYTCLALGSLAYAGHDGDPMLSHRARSWPSTDRTPYEK